MIIVRRDPTKGYIDCWLWVPKTFINVPGVKRSLTHVVPSYDGTREKVVELFKEAPDHILVPRAFWDVATLPFDVIDCRPQEYEDVNFASSIKLDHRMQQATSGHAELLPTGKDVQRISVDALCGAVGGVLQLGCGMGKTAIVLEHIARRRVPALVMVDNTQLMSQWLAEAARFLHTPGGVGVLGDGKREWDKHLVLATYQTVASVSDTMPEDIRRRFGGIYWDEGHHVGAPTFAKTAAMFYGRRYSITATPERADGFHVVADMHIGKVLHKDLSQPLKARIIFKHTELELDMTDPACDVKDRNGQVHGSKLFVYFGRWRQRLNMIIQDCKDAEAAGRSLIVICSGVEEVVGLLSLWTRGPAAPLLCDVPYPSPGEVGETILPAALSDVEAAKLERILSFKRERLKAAKKNAKTGADKLEEEVASLAALWERYQVYKKCEALNNKRRSQFIRDLVAEPSTAGALTHEIPTATRLNTVKTKRIIFAIMKYGKEALDAPHLDTILVSTPMTQKGGIQQLLGRIIGRPMPGKKSCVCVFYRDNIGLMHGMCNKIMRVLSGWPVDEGGPLAYEILGQTMAGRTRGTWVSTPDLKTAFEQ
jgi:superfamily II DNA or RNA helicase